MYNFYEFFAGGGMVRAGLGSGWKCLFANDFDYKKGGSYKENWGDSEICISDIRTVEVGALPSTADLMWGSFPCQDLSLAGGGAGLRGDRSGTFWPFWDLVLNLSEDNRAPRVIVLENVCGTLSSHRGRDFAAIADAMAEAGYNFGAVVIDAKLFLPQSRPRLFIIGCHHKVTIPQKLIANAPVLPWHTTALRKAHQQIPSKSLEKWIWWDMPGPPVREITIADVLEKEPQDVKWHTDAETKKLIELMDNVNCEKLNRAKQTGVKFVGCVYKRTRQDKTGMRFQRAEVRFDGLSGCLRTPAGGSSRQTLLFVEKELVSSRLISKREAARLMGLPETFKLPDNYNEAYHLIGDGVAVDVVRFLSKNLFEPIIDESRRQTYENAA